MNFNLPIGGNDIYCLTFCIEQCTDLWQVLGTRRQVDVVALLHWREDQLIVDACLKLVKRFTVQQDACQCNIWRCTFLIHFYYIICCANPILCNNMQCMSIVIVAFNNGLEVIVRCPCKCDIVFCSFNRIEVALTLEMFNRLTIHSNTSKRYTVTRFSLKVELIYSIVRCIFSGNNEVGACLQVSMFYYHFLTRWAEYVTNTWNIRLNHFVCPSRDNDMVVQTICTETSQWFAI